MRSPLLAIFCLVVAAAGWYYLFYSRAAERLGAIEAAPANLQRVRLRRVGGFVIMLLGATLYVGFFGVSWDSPSKAFVAVWLLVFAELAAATVLALADVILTQKIRTRPTNLPPPDIDSERDDKDSRR
jgi:hypothetical protein